MDERRSFNAHVALFANYSTRVAQLPTASWDRLIIQCGALDGQSFSALFARARLAARPYELWVPAHSTGLSPLNIIAGASRATQIGLAVASELISGFGTPDAPDPKWQATESPTTVAFVAANARIESALAPFARTHPGVASAVRAAGLAVLRHDWLSNRDFTSTYALVEPEIPFHSIDDTNATP